MPLVEKNLTKFRSGYVSIVGKPNVGKSTLLNSIIGEKIAIVSPKPQTTRDRIAGILNIPEAQIIFIDTPGIHRPRHKLGEAMVREAKEAIKEVDIILFMVEPKLPDIRDRLIIDVFKDAGKPVFLLINKIDKIKKTEILPVIDSYKEIYSFDEIIPISALKGDGKEHLINTIVKYLPEGIKYYPEDMLTDRTERFMVSEIIREKIIYKTEEEIPYSVAVEITEWSERQTEGKEKVIFIHANIYVEREGQKGIIIGKKGARLKSIGMAARQEIERLLDARVFLELQVKTKKDWRSDLRILKELGY
jgi:GTP-binding protein Era